MNNEKKDFDKEANSWDEDPRKVKLANEIADAILAENMLTSEMDVLDFGCGTGLVTLRVQPMVRSVIGIDSSQKMLDVLNKKITQRGLTNVSTRYLELENGDVLAGQYHLIISSMTFHHIKQIRPLLGQLYKSLTIPGCLCIADLDSDEGRFHDDNQGVFHTGFDRHELRKILAETGFKDIRDRTAAEMAKTVAGEQRCFGVFLMTACKGS